MKIYEQFKQALLKATSKEHREEIMELKMECDIIFDNGTQLGVYCGELEGRICWETKSVEIFTVIRPDGNNVYEVERKSIVEILGRPLNLEDVIKALDIKSNKYKGNEYPSKSHWLGAMILNIISEWQLGQPAHLQSDETLIAITNLLK